MRETARKLNLTTTETFRQLQRLSEALLIQKTPEGTYGITEYGRLVLRQSASLELLHKYREYFSTRDFQRLPYQFLNRIAELSGAEFKTDTMENINTAERITREAEKYMWGGGAEQPLNIGPILRESVPKGLKYKFLFPKRFIPKEPSFPGEAQAIEWRSMEDLPVNCVTNEKEAGISFRFKDGKADYVGFIGTDPTFVNWVKDLFFYYWDKGQRI